MKSTTLNRTINAVIETVGIMAIGSLFYMPIWAILPDAEPLRRWAAWALGYIGGFAVLWYIRWRGL